jgi:hypothetical protein
MTDAQISRHEITLRFVLTGERSPSISEEERLLREITKLPGWSFIDHYGIECERFQVFQPEFDERQDADNLPDGVTMYLITFGSDREIPMDPEASNTSWDGGVMAMVNRIRTLMESRFPFLRYVRSTECKKFEYSTNSNLQF